MYLVKFDKSSIPADYPENFKNTAFYESIQAYIGEYYGEDNLTAFEGELPVEGEAVRIISAGAFKRRFPASVRKSIRESDIDSVIDMREDLELALYVDLDQDYVKNGVFSLGPDGLSWLTEDEVNAQLRDGDSVEKYNGPL